MTNATSINADRAQWARSAVDHFAKETGADVYSEAISDLICNLGHLCAQEQLDFVKLIADAVGVWRIEQIDPAGVSAAPPVIVVIGEVSVRPPRYADEQTDHELVKQIAYLSRWR